MNTAQNLNYKPLTYYLDKLKEHNLDYEILGGSSNLDQVPLAGIAYDSRKVAPGFAFFGLTGQHVDGNSFIENAIKSGATSIVSETKLKLNNNVPLIVVKNTRLALALFSSIFYEMPDQKLNLIGITGTNGKTTTTHLLEKLVDDLGIIGTLGARWPNSSNYEFLNFTTPNPPELNLILKRQLDDGVKNVAMEVSSHALSLDRVSFLDFNIACLTNITQDHLDFHKTMENYVNSKFKLFENLLASKKPDKFAILNKDASYGQDFEERLNNLNAPKYNVTVLTYGFSDKASLYVKNYTSSFDSSNLEIGGLLGNLTLTVPVIGLFNIYNVLAAMLVAHACKIEISTILARLKDFQGVAGRFEKVSSSSQQPLCIVDYAHTPDGLANVLTAARGLTPANGKLIVVFGCGGDRDSSKRPQMGSIAEKLADIIIITSDNPRSEDPEQIIADILTGIKKLKNVQVESDRQEAIKLAINLAKAKDVIVIAGKGHENYQIIGDKTIHFDDREIARANLKLKV